MNQNISSVQTVCFSINKSNPPQLSVTAAGTVNSSGWSGGALIPRIYVAPPQDGIQEFDFVAEAPSGVVLWVMSPISGDGTIQMAQWMEGVRVYSATNFVSALLSEAACAVGQGTLDQHYLHTSTYIPNTAATPPLVLYGLKQPKLAGGNGNANGR
ncbi:hypothetical protein GGD92_04360 [Pseudomonas protegens]|uniref:Uncharacterized protein n=1 Tax=Pseudomonas protegens TaxID=380021 RepID=A0A7G7XC15_9PSED|nr:hypothetical protein [Pseudomonas protegens]QNH77510.1 hypothetical protein GGI48_30495 [Pseudomonas protegens]QNL06706.1 hypothetical protein GGD92_04360 [Pseudomonas protegens]